jgi:D-alanyl-D-alanine carboxypeptidase (penicillin-binding protein 5/6)
VEPSTGKVLWSVNPKKAMPIASMTKMMTALLAAEALREGEVSMNEPVRVTKAASRIGGSDIWLDPRETISFGNLFKAMMVKSANDAAYLIAQRLGGGSASNFVEKMNDRAKRLGLKRARFHNPHGLPEKKLGENLDSPEELAFLASVLAKYPEVLKLSSTKIDYIPRKVGKNKRTQLVNTNRLVRSGCPGVDGMKTGYTKKAGFCLTVTCERKGRRLVAVMTGFSSSKERNRFAAKLLDWGYKRLRRRP